MPSSIAKREKLVGPLQLALIGVLFAISFFFLLPKQASFTINDTDTQSSGTSVIGELDLAYLKARSASGQPSIEETSNAIAALVRSGQLDAARELLEQSSGTSITEQQQYSFDLEMAIADYFAADSAELVQLTRQQLLNRIELLISNPKVRTVSHLEKAANLSAQLEQPVTSVALYKLLAVEDSNKASHWFSKCAQGLSFMKQAAESSLCYEKAIKASTSQDEKFELQIALLTQLSIVKDVTRQDNAIKKLTVHQPLTNAQREKLATVLLANQRPEKAYLIYEQLAKNDLPNKAKWLLAASKWAQASNQNVIASNYLKQAAELKSGAEKAALLKQVDSILVASGKSDLAFERIVKRIKKHPDDVMLLRDGTFQAIQLGKTKYARAWNQRVIELDPDDVDAVNNQIDFALASRDLSKARKWSEHAVALAPNSKEARLRLARVLEWDGDPVAAQNQWEWIVERYSNKENVTQLIRLASLNRDSHVAAPASRKLLFLAPTDHQNISRLIELYELDGLPIEAANVLEELQQKSGFNSHAQRELARLFQRHTLYPEALDAWNLYASNVGRSSEESLNRMELHWRLNQPAESAEIAKHLIDTSFASEASDFQVQIISEIAWRYKIPQLAMLVKPHMAKIKDQYKSDQLSKRFIQSLEDDGKYTQAIVEATQIWSRTGSNDAAFTAMNLAFKTGNARDIQPLLSINEKTTELHNNAAYWNLAASIHQKNGEPESAAAAFKRALKLEPKNTSAISGLLWSHIDSKNLEATATMIEQYKDVAEEESELWSVFAVAHVQLGLPELSLTWFDRQIDRIEADYNMLLTYADALEYAGRAEPARIVRLYAIKRLRPVLTEGTRTDKSELVRQYAQLLSRYGSAEDKETLAKIMLGDMESMPVSDQFWREDIAISWLMSTQRHEHARLVMAKIHSERLQAPAWQKLSLGLATNNLTQIKQVLNNAGSISIGNHILALRHLGRDRQAYALAKSASNRAPTIIDRAIARSQYSAMRTERPSYSASRYKQIEMDGLAIAESGFTIKHSLHNTDIGLALDYKNQQLHSDVYNLNNDSARQNLSLTLHHGNRRFGGELTAGFDMNDAEGRAYVKARHHVRSLDGDRILSAEIAYNEPSEASALFRLTAIESSLSIEYEQALGFREYMKLQANVKDINSRVQQNRITRGLSTRMEFGVRGAFGSNVWATNISANRSQNDTVSNLPAELALSSPSSSVLLAEQTTSVVLGASLSRGGVQSNYPQASSPRYYLNANVGRVWPQATYSAQFDAGAGIRILGGDELSIGFTHEAQPFDQFNNNSRSTSVGINYRYHF